MSLRLLLLALPLIAATGCGTPFVKGWRGKEKPVETGPNSCAKNAQWDPKRGCVEDGKVDLGLTDNQSECEATGKATWTEGHCLPNDQATENQCANITGWTWLGDKGCVPAAEASCLKDPAMTWDGEKCVGKPTLTTSGGAVTQSIAAGVALTAIDLQVSDGATIKVENESCPGFISKSGNQIVSGDAYKLPEGKTSCELDLVPALNDVEGDATHVAVTIERGFYAICIDSNATDDENDALRLLLNVLKAGDCQAANDELVKQTIIDLSASAAPIKDAGVFRALKGLQRLDLSNNDITDLSPLAHLDHLSVLFLANNAHLKDLSPLAQAPALQKLVISGTAVVRSDAKTCPNANVNAALAAVCKVPAKK
jgi:hypothetical protein